MLMTLERSSAALLATCAEMTYIVKDEEDFALSIGGSS